MNPQLHPSGQRIACYDDPESFDRYTVVYLDQPEEGTGTCAAVGMSERPFHPGGFGQHTACPDGPHLGNPILFTDLPADCQRLVNQDLTS